MEATKLGTTARARAAARFVRFLPDAHNAASRFAYRYNRPLHEMQDEAEGILADILIRMDDEYDPSKAKEHTYVCRKLNWRLLDYCTRRPERAKPFSQLKIFEVEGVRNIQPRHCQNIDPLQPFRELGREAVALVSLIINAPAEIADEVCVVTRGRGRRAVRRFLRKEQGWSKQKLDSAWKEVLSCL